MNEIFFKGDGFPFAEKDFNPEESLVNIDDLSPPKGGHLVLKSWKGTVHLIENNMNRLKYFISFVGSQCQ